MANGWRSSIPTSQRERLQEWKRIHQGEARLVVGPRSALFAPCRDLALIVVDEEHDNAYKQSSSPRYHGRDMALLRGRLENAAVVLASATPSLESRLNAQNAKLELLQPDPAGRLGHACPKASWSTCAPSRRPCGRARPISPGACSRRSAPRSRPATRWCCCATGGAIRRW